MLDSQRDTLHYACLYHLKGKGHVLYQQWPEALGFKTGFKNYTPAYNENYCCVIKYFFLVLKVAKLNVCFEL